MTQEAPADADTSAWRPPRPALHLVRFAFFRGLGLIYMTAMGGLLFHVGPLLGSQGITPVGAWLARVQQARGASAVWQLPTLFWLSHSDAVLTGAAAVGLGLALLLLLGLANAPLLFALWLLQLSFVGVGQVWLGYGWETLLLETGFLAIFLAPPLDPRPLRPTALPVAVVWLLRWVLLRLYLGAGLIKLRGDACWRDLSCLRWHYETQPVPNPLSWLLHQAPPWFHTLGVAWNHGTELVVPFGLLLPRRFRNAAAALMALFQVFLIFSGNLSWLNWLSLVLCIAALDDGALARLLPRGLVARAAAASAAAPPLSRSRWVLTAGLCLGVGLLSIGPVANLLSSQQSMNSSFDPLHLVNSYGAFGSVGKVRDEVIILGTADDPEDPQATWKEYELPCKPGDPDRHPCVITPWHYRLDWQLWFAAMESPQRAPWLVHLAWLLVQGDRSVERLFAQAPFPDVPPRAVRVDLYRYRFTTWGEPG